MKKIYMLGVGGTAMGNLAQMFKKQGAHVTGTDLNIYPPMSTQLEKANIPLNKGYKVENIPENLDLVIIGNVIRRDNVEAQEILNKGYNYLSMPEALNKYFIDKKQSIVISGTHGKTTTSFLTAWMLENSGLKPGFFIGGVPKDFDVMGREALGDYFVVEGDEYDTAFFDKEAKFFHYNPKYLILTGIEFDHADIFDDIDTIKNSFAKLLSQLPKDGLVIYNGDDRNILDIIGNAECKKLSYGLNRNDYDYSAHNLNVIKSSATTKLADPELVFDFYNKKKLLDKLSLRIPGEHNVMNAVAVCALGLELGIELDKINNSINSFRGIKRRQEVIGTPGGRILIDDFAHHPTAISYTIDAINEWYSPRKIWCVYEPRTATARTNKLENELIFALSKGENIVIAPVHQPDRVNKEDRLDTEKVAKVLNEKGRNAVNLDSVDQIVEYLCKETVSGDVILIMSNGGFGDIYIKLMENL